MRRTPWFVTLLMVLLLSTALLEAKRYTYLEVHKMPQSIEKDYYIWRFLTQPSTTPQEARRIIQDASRLNKKLKTAYKKKTGFPARLLPKPPIAGGAIVNPTHIKNNAKANKLFKEGIRLVGKNQLQKAATLFYQAHNHYTKRWEKDKTLFWLYLLTEDDAYLKPLLKSYHINLYTLLGADLKQQRYPATIITPTIHKRHLFGIDAKDPIDWAKIKAKMNQTSTNLEALAESCKSEETIGIYSYLKAKACNYRKSYFPMPYRDTMKHFSKQRQALIYAIARQESRFVPASVSRSFALGMMQFMPFLIEHIAKKKGEYIDLDMMFSPHKAIEYANFHLDYLGKYLYHPLFVAYAYNGGIGFTKRLIKKKEYFRRGAFEPYLSMEKMTNVEAREYGKRVLVNYVIYLNKLGVRTRLLPLMAMLTNPAQTDSFRP